MSSPYVEEASRQAALISEQAARQEAMAKARWDELCATSGGERSYLEGRLADFLYEIFPNVLTETDIGFESTTPSGKCWRVTLEQVVP